MDEVRLLFFHAVADCFKKAGDFLLCFFVFNFMSFKEVIRIVLGYLDSVIFSHRSIL